MVERRERYVARLMQEPGLLGFSAVKFVHTAQVATTLWVRMRCQYLCHHVRQSDFCPPFSPEPDNTRRLLDEFNYGIMVRRDEPVPFARPYVQIWHDFQEAILEAESESFVRGYTNAFAIATGNCVFCHHDDSIRPCVFPGKKRPTLEAIGVNLRETLAAIAWDDLLTRKPTDPFPMFGLILLE